MLLLKLKKLSTSNSNALCNREFDHNCIIQIMQHPESDRTKYGELFHQRMSAKQQ